MENAETKIKCQKQQFLSKVILGLMTFFLWKKILWKAISSTNYLTEIHLEWLGSNQSVWAHRKMTCYMILTEMTSLCEQKRSMGLVQPKRLGDWLLFHLALVQRRTIFRWYLLKSHCKFFRSTQEWKLNFQNCYMHDRKNIWLFCTRFPVHFTSSPNKSGS